MSKTEPLNFDKSSLPKFVPPRIGAPPPRLSPPRIGGPMIWTRKLVNGTRECEFTTVRFVLEGRGSAWDTLTIEIDEHNGAPSSRLKIRGAIEAAEITSHLRWLADAIAHQGKASKDNPPAIREYVTCKEAW